jgi:hypothetical protein
MSRTSSTARCRHCGAKLEAIFADLGSSPPSNSYLDEPSQFIRESSYPLRVLVCESCWLVQTEDFAAKEVFFHGDYAYFSSTSETWRDHSKKYFEEIVSELNLTHRSFVIEVASNDGYLLRHFLAGGVPCLGVEPAGNAASIAVNQGIPVIKDFFGSSTARSIVAAKGLADLIICNNVFAHVPDINDFAKGLEICLDPGGTITIEFPHILNLILETQFDTIYHEHYSYLSLHAASAVLESAGLRVYKVQKLNTHGGSLRLYVSKRSFSGPLDASVSQTLILEEKAGLNDLETYINFQESAFKVASNFREFIIQAQKDGKIVAGYGAAAKGNTLLNFSGVKYPQISVIADAAPSKQGKYTPGSHIPIVHPNVLKALKPDYLVIFPWNISDEVVELFRGETHPWKVKFVTAVPDLRIFD